MTSYDFEEHEQTMAYHNQYLRGQEYHISSQRYFDLKKDGICNCYDCMTFFHIVFQYLQSSPFHKVVTLRRVLIHMKYMQTSCVRGFDLYKATIKNRNKFRK
jgi:hypothetical protein